MRAFLCEVDPVGLRRFLPEEVVSGGAPGLWQQTRLSRPTMVVWALLDRDDAEAIRQEVAAEHPGAACGLLLNRAVEIISLGAAVHAAVGDPR